jgi:hypothetical protein
MSGKARTAIVHIGFGFRRNPKFPFDTAALSIVDIARSNQVCTEYARIQRQLQNRDYSLELWFTGQGTRAPLPNGAGSVTLATLNLERTEASLEESDIDVRRYASRQINGLTAFGECWETVELARVLGVKNFVVVSSCFYFTVYRRMWERAAERAGIHTRMVMVSHDKGVVSPAARRQYSSLRLRTLASVAASSRFGHFAVTYPAEFMRNLHCRNNECQMARHHNF